MISNFFFGHGEQRSYDIAILHRYRRKRFDSAGPEKLDEERFAKGNFFWEKNSNFLYMFTDFGKKKRPHGVIAVYDVGDKELAKRYGLVKTDANGKILEFQEKPPQPATTLASSGIYWLPREIWSLLDTYISSGHNTDQPGHYMRWLAENSGLFAFSLRGKWLDIGDLASYQQANAIVNPPNPKE